MWLDDARSAAIRVALGKAIGALQHAASMEPTGEALAPARRGARRRRRAAARRAHAAAGDGEAAGRPRDVPAAGGCGRTPGPHPSRARRPRRLLLAARSPTIAGRSRLRAGSPTSPSALANRGPPPSGRRSENSSQADRDLFTFGDATPQLIDYAGGGSAKAWTSTLDEALRLDFDTVIPGHGRIARREDLRAFRDRTLALSNRVREMVVQKRSRGDLAHARNRVPLVPAPARSRPRRPHRRTPVAGNTLNGEPVNVSSTHRCVPGSSGAGSIRSRRSIFDRPCRDTPSAFAATWRWPPAWASAARTKRRSKSSRATSNDEPVARERSPGVTAETTRRCGRGAARERPSRRWRSAARERCRASRSAPARPARRGRAPRASRRDRPRRARSAARAAATSPGRSRSGGTVMRRTSSRKRRSTRKRPSAASRSSWRLVAATIADVHAPRQVLADAPDLPFLEHAQQLGLRPRRQLPHFVEEQRAAVGLLEQPRPLRRGAGEGAARVAEELGFDQVVAERRAVDRAEAPRVARRELVDRPRDQFLATTALTLDEHGERRPRGAVNGVAQRRRRRALSEQIPPDGGRRRRGRSRAAHAGAWRPPWPPRAVSRRRAPGLPGCRRSSGRPSAPTRSPPQRTGSAASGG